MDFEKGIAVLDVGCGSGSWIMVSNREWGVDPISRALASLNLFFFLHTL